MNKVIAETCESDELPLVSVVIPHLNDHQRLSQCLDCLRRQHYPSDRFEIIVVDNGSDRPLDLSDRFPEVIVTSEAEKGCGTARNKGVTLARGDVLAFTDSDTLPTPEWLSEGVRALRFGDVVGGEILVFCADEEHPTQAELYDKVFGFEQLRYVRWKGFAAGANILTRRETFERIGPFRNGSMPEDLEWGRRAKALGLSIVFARRAIIWHPARHSWAELTKKMDRTVTHHWNHVSQGRNARLKWLAIILLLLVPPIEKAWILARTPLLSHPWLRVRAFGAVLRLRGYRIGRMVSRLLGGDEQPAAAMDASIQKGSTP